MKIYSWNMLYRNKELDRAFDFIAKGDWDIFCLQEVPEEFLARLKTLQVAVAAAIETDREFKKERSTQYVVILSRYPIRAFEPISLPYYDHSLSLRRKLFTRLMFALRLWGKGLGNRHALHADVETPTGIMHVFNLHLALIHPTLRLKEFEMTMLEHDPARPTIVCGDFNILESFHIAPLNLLLGGRVSDALFFSRERTQIEQRFFEHQLVNPLRGKSTHPLSQSQLDHILISKSLSIKNAEVLKDRMGSDHCPIRVELT